MICHGNKDIYITNGLLRDIRNTDADKKISVDTVTSLFINLDHTNHSPCRINNHQTLHPRFKHFCLGVCH